MYYYVEYSTFRVQLAKGINIQNAVSPRPFLLLNIQMQSNVFGRIPKRRTTHFMFILVFLIRNPINLSWHNYSIQILQI